MFDSAGNPLPGKPAADPAAQSTDPAAQSTDPAAEPADPAAAPAEPADSVAAPAESIGPPSPAPTERLADLLHGQSATRPVVELGWEHSQSLAALRLAVAFELLFGNDDEVAEDDEVTEDDQEDDSNEHDEVTEEGGDQTEDDTES